MSTSFPICTCGPDEPLHMRDCPMHPLNRSASSAPIVDDQRIELIETKSKLARVERELAAKDAEIARVTKENENTWRAHGEMFNRLATETGDFRREIAALRQQLTAAEAEKAELREGRDRWRMRFDSAMEQWQSERKDLTAKLEEAKRKHSNSEGFLSVVTQQRDEALTQLRSLRTALADAEKARDAMWIHSELPMLLGYASSAEDLLMPSANIGAWVQGLLQRVKALDSARSAPPAP